MARRRQVDPAVAHEVARLQMTEAEEALPRCFRVDDLEANRAGRLSRRQRRSLLRSEVGAVVGAIACLVAAVAWVLLLTLRTSRADYANVGLEIVFRWVAPPVLVVAALIFIGSARQAVGDLRSGRVAVVDGRPHLRSSYGAGSALGSTDSGMTLGITVGGVDFELHGSRQWAAWSVLESLPHRRVRARYAPRTGRLLTIELLADAPGREAPGESGGGEPAGPDGAPRT